MKLCGVALYICHRSKFALSIIWARLLIDVVAHTHCLFLTHIILQIAPACMPYTILAISLGSCTAASYVDELEATLVIPEISICRGHQHDIL